MSKPEQHEDDTTSYCGSFSGETFSSRRDKSGCTLRQHSINNVAAQLRNMSFVDPGADVGKSVDDLLDRGKTKFNTVFHHYRFCVAMMGGLSVGLVMILRYNITVAILNMVNQTHLYLEEHPNRTMDDFLAEGYLPIGEFNWDNEIQHMIMSWYMIAYTLPQVGATRIGQIFGVRVVIPISLGLCAISTALTPPLAYYGWEYVIFLRLINGIGASAVIPMLLNLVEHWMPYDQVSLGLTCAQVLQCLMSASQPLISGYLSSIHWKWAFYGPAAATMVFCLAWFVLVTDRPDDNWLISQRELDLICCCSDTHHNHRRQQITGRFPQETKKQQGQANQVPWVRILRVPSFYCYIIMWCCYCSAFSSFTFILPTYLRQFLKIPISQNGFYCSIITSGGIISVIWPHFTIEFLRNKLSMSETSSRRLTHVILCSVVAFTWIYVGCFNQYQLPLLFINRAFHGANDIVVTGTLMSNYAKAGLSSTVFSMVNTIGNFVIVFASTFIGWVLDYTGQRASSWAYIFTGLGFSQLLMAFIFLTTIRAGPIDLGPKQAPDDLEQPAARKEGNSIMNNFEKAKQANSRGEP